MRQFQILQNSVLFSLILVSGSIRSKRWTSNNIIYQYTFQDLFPFCPKGVNFTEWDFAESNLLAETFPIDPETRNYVRQVRRFVRLVSGTEVASQSVPLAHRYGGHQFGDWSGQLGDGRAVMLGEYVNSKGERWELQLKGSGKTPYSRHGDGRAVFRSSVREFLASEAMHYLGVPTSRVASLVVSDEQVWRDQFYDGHPIREKAAVVLRLAKSWFRIGSLEILTSNGETDLLRKVVDFVIEQHFNKIKDSKEKYLEFFSQVVTKTAHMIAIWQALGFAHGVCNTDNFSLLSMTIDYGPFGFMDTYNSDFVPNTSDDEGRYSFSNQPSAGQYNLAKLLDALSPLIDLASGKKILQGYAAEFNNCFMDLHRQKLGLVGRRDEDDMLIKSFLQMMESSQTDFTMTFRQLGNLILGHIEQGVIPPGAWALDKLKQQKNWRDWLGRYQERLGRNGDHDTDEKRRIRMHAVNPRYVLRNWMAQTAIDKANRGDYTEIRHLMDVLQRPFNYQESAERAGYAAPPPPWSTKLRVSCSS
ncbi:protein adenylyltransferase SelO isoform X2 [Nematostella vectensis]|uniref:protein adenylyltransferase SelO isoform X2 n=1 Tax=Nematostella vectensis TaxID=45351 RepID=UPI002076E5E2|nr:protein adenylyltransferase SelO isoform X2 [Nematostella vectensis]